MVRIVGQDCHRPFQSSLVATVCEHPGRDLRPGVVIARMVQEPASHLEQRLLVLPQAIECLTIGSRPIGIAQHGPHPGTDVEGLVIERIGLEGLLEPARGGGQVPALHVNLGARFQCGPLGRRQCQGAIQEAGRFREIAQLQRVQASPGQGDRVIRMTGQIVFVLLGRFLVAMNPAERFGEALPGRIEVGIAPQGLAVVSFPGFRVVRPQCVDRFP